MLNTDFLNCTRRVTYSEIRKSMYFTFYPILVHWGYVEFKYSTELYFDILKWMKQHLMTYYKTILISSKLSYISQPDYKCAHNKMVKEAHLSHWRLLQIQFHSYHMWVTCNFSWTAHQIEYYTWDRRFKLVFK